ncbi:MAG: tetratricopeptide repeat protein [Myxococcales bacterium]|nr:tetratricopeptide repeat protein [Myxococcales bacterium]
MEDTLKQAIVLGREYYSKREYGRAESYLRTVIDSGAHGFADIHNMMGVIHHDSGRLEEARDEFRRALDINPRYTEAALNLAVTYNDLGDYTAAQQTYRVALGRGTDGSERVDSYARGKIANLHAEVAQAYVDLDMPNEAIQEYRSAIRLCPQFADLRVKLADVYRHVGDLESARYELSEAIRVRPDYLRARVAMGVVHLVSGKRQQAIEEWERALRIDPHDKSARMYLRMAKDPPVPSEPPPG